MVQRGGAQAYVEYGLLVAILVIAFLVGTNALMGGAATYLAHAEPTPNATVLAGLPNHVVSIVISCPPALSPNYTGDQISCSLSVTDMTTIEARTLPRGTMEFGSTSSSDSSPPVAGTFDPNPCTLAGTGVTSTCLFSYTPTYFGTHDLTAKYHPTSNHKSAVASWAGVAKARDRTQMRGTCLQPVPVGEPSQCTLGVYDLYPPRVGFLPGLNLTISTSSSAGSGTFSAEKQLSPQNEPSTCTTDAALSCGTLFRSGPSLADQIQHLVLAAFGGDENYDRADNFASPQIVNVGGPTVHPVSVQVACRAGQTPLQINQNQSTLCTATVTDTNAADSNGNPTNITPTGQVSWRYSPGSGGAGNLSTATCSLSPVDNMSAYCQSTYTPTAVGTPPGPDYVGDHSITATFSGDRIHPDTTTQGSTDVYVTDQHRVQVITPPCTNGSDRLFPLLVGVASADSTQCTVTVTDQATNPQTPTGTVSWGLQGTDGNGTFTPMTCTLQPAGSGGSATCAGSVSYKATSRGTPDGTDQESTHALAATYSGDWLHPQIGDQTQSTAVYVGNLHTVSVGVSCLPGDQRNAALSVALAQTSTCTVSVVDPGPSPRTPTGQVGWNMTPVGQPQPGAGTFTSPAPCQLTSAGPGTATCQVTYRPTARGTPDGGLPATVNTHNITATYSGDGLHPPPGGVPQTSSPAAVYVDN